MTPEPAPGRRSVAMSLHRALHLLVLVLLAAAVLHTHFAGSTQVHGIDQTLAAALVAAAFLGIYALGGFIAFPEDPFSPSQPAPGAASLLWLLGLMLAWASGMLLSDGFVWVSLPLCLLVLAVLPARPGAVVLLVLLCCTAGLNAIHNASAGVATSHDTWLAMVAMAAVAVVGHAVVAELRRESAQQRLLIQRLTDAQESLATSQRQTGVLAERERLAREIHDTLGQGLASIVVLSRTAAQAEPTQRTRAIALIEQTARDNLAEARRFIHDLGGERPDSLVEALRVIAQDAARLAAASGASLDVEVTGTEPAVDARTATALCQGVRASVANVVQHAGATKCRIGITEFDDRLVVDIVDDGRGFDPDAVDAHAHFGLAGLRSRMAEVGGSVFVDSEPGWGTTVALTIPRAGTVSP